MQILPGIYQANGSPYGRHQNGYLIRHSGATVLIDSGDMEESTLDEVERNLARWGVRIEDVTHLFVTHAHFDHASHAAALQRRGVRIVASPLTAEAMASGDERCIGYAVQRAFEPCHVDEVIQEGQDYQVGGLELRAIAVPGHCADMVLFETMLGDERVWFVGDLFEAVHAHRLINLPYMGAPDFDRATYIASLKRALTFPHTDHVLPGHGPVAIGRGRRLVEMAYNEALMSWR